MGSHTNLECAVQGQAHLVLLQKYTAAKDLVLLGKGGGGGEETWKDASCGQNVETCTLSSEGGMAEACAFTLAAGEHGKGERECTLDEGVTTSKQGNTDKQEDARQRHARTCPPGTNPEGAGHGGPKTGPQCRPASAVAT